MLSLSFIPFFDVDYLRKKEKSTIDFFLFSLNRFWLRQFFTTKKNMTKKIQNLMVFEKTKKIFFWKTRLPAKPEYPENRETSETFFNWFFPKIKFSKSPHKKNRLMTYVMFRSLTIIEKQWTKFVISKIFWFFPLKFYPSTKPTSFYFIQKQWTDLSVA